MQLVALQGQLDAVHGHGSVHTRRQPRGHVPPHHRLAEEDHQRVCLLADALTDGHVGVALVVLEHGIIDDYDLIGAQGRALLGQALHAGAQEGAGRRAAEALGRPQQLSRYGCQLAVFCRLSENEYSARHSFLLSGGDKGDSTPSPLAYLPLDQLRLSQAQGQLLAGLLRRIRLNELRLHRHLGDEQRL